MNNYKSQYFVKLWLYWQVRAKQKGNNRENKVVKVTTQPLNMFSFQESKQEGINRESKVGRRLIGMKISIDLVQTKRSEKRTYQDDYFASILKDSLYIGSKNACYVSEVKHPVLFNIISVFAPQSLKENFQHTRKSNNRVCI